MRKTFLWTYLGMAVTGIWLLSLGALIGQAFPLLGVIESVRAAGDSVFSGLGALLILAALPGALIVMGLNIYGGSLNLLTMTDSFKPIRPTRRARITAVVLVASAGLGLVYGVSNNFLADFGTFLVFLLYLFGPWTAVNLVDFYAVRKGHYSIREIFNRHHDPADTPSLRLSSVRHREPPRLQRDRLTSGACSSGEPGRSGMDEAPDPGSRGVSHVREWEL